MQAKASSTLRITEIFHSLQGEARTAGCPTVFVRLTGCPLRCGYCDTAYAFSGGESRTLDAILEEVAQYAPRFITVTGGEPLAQPGCAALLTALCDLPTAPEVSLETSGALPITGLDARVSVVLDLKTPGSGEVSRNLWENIPELKLADQVKFVLCDRADYEWARLKLETLALAERVGEVLFSPSTGVLTPETLAGWILEDRLPVRMQLQLHKIIWGDRPGV
ncbi:MAG: 7-carboxy-7-deazaguanine synthase QueE [Pseudomonadales bacterium]|nr:7-carboxy-7-deazaguanine synthase QueE [Pseudomonadales bacterium]